MSSMPKLTDLQKVYTSEIGDTEEKRLWLDSNRLFDTAFIPGKNIEVDIKPRKATVKLNAAGKRIVQQRRGKPVIDIQNKELSAAFEGVTEVAIRIFTDRVEFTPLGEEYKQQQAKGRAENPMTFISMFSGGDTLGEGFKQAGFRPVAAVEIEDKYLEGGFEPNNPGVLTVCAPIQKVNWLSLPAADALLAGIPCNCWTPAGKAKAKDTGAAVEEAGDTGYLAFYVLEAIRTLRPGVVVLENVEAFASSAIANVVRNVLRQMGYFITERIFHAFDLGGHTKRKRMVMVASMKGPVEIPESVAPSGMTIEDHLEVPMDEREWLTAETNASIATFLRREAENQRPGSKKNFGIGRVRATDTVAPTITKHYMKRQMTQPVLVKEENGKEYFSWFSPRELARINGVPDSYELPTSATTACEIIGQGVDTGAFRVIAEAILAA